jgi:hypothetical protein
MLEKLKKLFAGSEVPVEKPKPEQSESKPEVKDKKPKKQLSPKEQATLDNQPYIQVLSIDVDPTDIHNGVFELDFNDKFVLNLVRAGYKLSEDDTDAVIVDRWFTTICRNIALEMYEQYQADPANRAQRDLRVVSRKNIGDGRSEIS